MSDMNQRFDRIDDKLDVLSDKLDKYSERLVKAETNLGFIKKGLAVVISIVTTAVGYIISHFFKL